MEFSSPQKENAQQGASMEGMQSEGMASAVRPDSQHLTEIQEAANQSPQVMKLKALQKIATLKKGLVQTAKAKADFEQAKAENPAAEGIPIQIAKAILQENGINPSPSLQQFETQPSAMDSSSGPDEIDAQHSKGPIQRKIYFNHNPQNPGFEVDGSRPLWRGKWRNYKGSLHRNHIIPFSYIENELAIMLNHGWFAASVEDEDFFDQMFDEVEELIYALYVDHQKEYYQSIDQMLNLYQAMRTLEFDDATFYANELLAELNSSPDNVRPGDPSINASIQNNLDCDFKSKIRTYSGQVFCNGIKTVHNQRHLLLMEDSNAILYRTFQATQGSLEFVQHATNHLLMSSKYKAPKGSSGLPVLVRDPDGVGIPILFE